MTTTEQDRELAQKIRTTTRELNFLLGEAATRDIEVSVLTDELRKTDSQGTQRITLSVDCRKMERLP